MNSAFEDFVYVGLVGLRFLSGEATKFVKDPRSDTDGDQMFGVAGDRTTNAAGATGCSSVASGISERSRWRSGKGLCELRPGIPERNFP